MATPPPASDVIDRRVPLSPTWWRTAVVYQVYVRSMADGNGDGIGDLAGIVSRLDYLAELGVDAIWLTPCFPSPQRDHGYDVADYFDIEPAYGTLATFDALVADARGHGIKILMDVVPNHCSNQHAWFQAALAAAPGSAERERFYFRDGKGPDGDEPPNNWRALFGGPAWTRIAEADGSPGQWYLHFFTPWQPDWNLQNHDVREQFADVLRFWFDRGVEGFRCDAVTVAGKAPGLPDQPPVPPGTPMPEAVGMNPYSVYRPEGHEAWRHWRSVVDEYAREHPGRHPYLVAEAYAAHAPERMLEYIRPDEFHQAFAFDLLLSPWIAGEFRRAIAESIDTLATRGLPLTWTLNNHDAQRTVTRYGRADADSMTSYTGNNLLNSEAPVDVALGTRRARAAAMLTLSLPGAAYLYVGEELGLYEVLDIPADRREDPLFINTDGAELGRDGCRVPLPWTADAATSFGFSTPPVTGRPWLPQPSNWGALAADAQAGDPTSTLSLYRAAVAVRRATPALTTEAFAWADLGDEVVSFRRGDVLVVFNPGARPFAVPAAVVADADLLLCSVHGHHDPATVPADSAVWLRVPDADGAS